MKTKIIFLLAIVSLNLHLLFAQTKNEVVSKRGTTAAPFLSISQGARALAMGSAFVAIADDPSAMYWNPAGITDIESMSFVVDHTTWIADIQYEFIGMTTSLGAFGALGVNITASDIDEMKVTTVDLPDGTGEIFNVTDLAVGVTYALKLTNDFSIGFNPKFIYQRIWKMSANAFAIDLGVKYRTPFEGVTLGMSITNLGTKMQMAGNNAIVKYDPDPNLTPPDPLATGNNGRIPAEISMDEWDLPLNFRVGLAYTLGMGFLGKLNLAVDAMHPSDNYECVNAGCEYVFDDFIYLRGGMKSIAQKDSEEGLTYGFGVRQFLLGNLKFSIDYAYQDFKRLKNAQKVSLGVYF
jgi:opacity protein-like surface antigen